MAEAKDLEGDGGGLVDWGGPASLWTRPSTFLATNTNKESSTRGVPVTTPNCATPFWLSSVEIIWWVGWGNKVNFGEEVAFVKRKFPQTAPTNDVKNHHRTGVDQSCKSH